MKVPGPVTGGEGGPSPEAAGARPCPRCPGPAELSPERLAALASQAPLPASRRAGEDLYRRRLNRCSSCGALREKVLCAYCGCFVSFRAAVRESWCPSPAGDQWAALSPQDFHKEIEGGKDVRF
jgi:hypothetical protein